MNSASEYKNLRDKVDDLMEKSTAPNFSIMKRVQTPHVLKRKKPPIIIVALRDMIRIYTSSSTATHMASSVTSPKSEVTSSSQAIHIKTKQPFSTIWVGVLLPTTQT